MITLEKELEKAALPTHPLKNTKQSHLYKGQLRIFNIFWSADELSGIQQLISDDWTKSTFSVFLK